MNEEIFLNVVSTFNSYKLLAKTFHWKEIQYMNKHEQLDKLYDLIVDFQDNFTEECIWIFGMPEIYKFHQCTNIQIMDAESLMQHIDEFIVSIKSILKETDNANYAGLESLVDNFIHDFNIIQYRFQLN